MDLVIQDGEIYDPTTNKRIAIDHDHQTGFIRGLLIQKVNWLVDQWEQNSYGILSMPPEILNYKQHPPAFKVLGKITYVWILDFPSKYQLGHLSGTGPGAFYWMAEVGAQLNGTILSVDMGLEDSPTLEGIFEVMTKS